MNVRNAVGKGLLESYYEAALSYELSLMGIDHRRQVLLPAIYKGVEVKDAYKMDIVVEDSIVVECKSLRQLSGYEFAQLYTYLKLSNKRIGYLINFSAKFFRPGVWTKGNPNLDQGIFRIVT